MKKGYLDRELTDGEAIKLLIAFVGLIWSIFTVAGIGLIGLISFIVFVASTFYIVWFLGDELGLLPPKE